MAGSRRRMAAAPVPGRLARLLDASWLADERLFCSVTCNAAVRSQWHVHAILLAAALCSIGTKKACRRRLSPTWCRNICLGCRSTPTVDAISATGFRRGKRSPRSAKFWRARESSEYWADLGRQHGFSGQEVDLVTCVPLGGAP